MIILFRSESLQKIYNSNYFTKTLIELFIYISSSYLRFKKNQVSISIYCWENVNLTNFNARNQICANRSIFLTRLRAGFFHSRRTASLGFFNFPMVLNKLFRQQKIQEFFKSKFNSSLTNWCQTELLILKIRAT